jgi:hypothetical protein
MKSGYYSDIVALEEKTLNCARRGLDGAQFDRTVKGCNICNLAYAEGCDASSFRGLCPEEPIEAALQ